MTAILGISAYYHDSAAAVVIDGEVKSVGKIPGKAEVLGWIR